MGYIAHDAVLVTLSDYVQDRGTEPTMPDVEVFRASLPEDWRPLVIGPVKSIINGYVSYVFLPDGSKEGWAPSDAGDEYRDQFAALFSFTYDDGSSPFDVVRVRFGGDDRETPSAAIFPARQCAGPRSAAKRVTVSTEDLASVLGEAEGFIGGKDNAAFTRLAEAAGVS